MCVSVHIYNPDPGTFRLKVKIIELIILCLLESYIPAASNPKPERHPL